MTGVCGAMAPPGVTALLLLPATLWFLVLLVLPLVVILVYSLGERAPEGGYAPALTLAQYANLPARWTAFQNTLTLAPLGTLLTLLAAYPAGLLAGAALPAALAAVPAGAGHRAVLDQPADPHLCLDLHPGRARPAGAAGLAGPGRAAPDQHALRGAAGHRLRLPAADGVPDLCQPGEARPAAAGGVGGPLRRTVADLPPGHAAAVAARAWPPARCWCSSC